MAESSTTGPKYTAVLGTSLKLANVETDGRDGLDICFADSSDGKRDLAMVSGTQTLAQDLAVAFLTPLGTDVFNTAFGFDGLTVLASGFDREATKEFFKLGIIRTVTADPRIKQVREVRFEPADDEQVASDRRWNVTVEADTVLGDTVAVPLGEVNLNG